ncbi:META domain-containing protein [Aestuariivirga sp.]|uniref:META domain-containing protein n=1 Tax=Aestuariivirga sp. TaxID=2650926 RepID=UPI0025BBF51C|nr:META domain-containing protein [Aestuariivirga sp.]MCA3555598.1 META domain-containing protein [Aestuariivirga sp.]
MRQLIAVSGLTLALLAGPALAHQEKLAGADWVLAGQTGQRAPFLRFEAGRVAGLGGCNRFGASYQLKGDRLSFSAIAATRMACDGMEAEQAFFAMLGKVKAMKLDGDRLELLDGQGKVLAAFARRTAE